MRTRFPSLPGSLT
ncbi:hypothetical protein EYF80_066219 [Liparis tanakae]|uniref:Uncharacterized protein n=1 Tax=Liparis tanakae TaxID=230148 RepID=A0A4Z2E4H8_9TELE|nr:hypothetical protein EYF80_066219 [Liparis tanakae]